MRKKKDFFWNAIASLLSAFQSVVILSIITRQIGIDAAGIFTIANTDANLFLNIGKYGMRYYQVSDIKNKYSFHSYLTSRIFTTLFMVITSFAFIYIRSVNNNYTKYKSLVIAWMCLFKAIDAIEDVFHGLFQKNGRLDIAAKCLFFRLLFSVILYCTLIWYGIDLLSATIAVTIFSATLCFVITLPFYQKVKLKKIKEKCKTNKLLISCFPIFVGAFLSYYIGNAPKYAIDRFFSDEMQACYGFISMPVFVIGLLASMIYSPIIVEVTRNWSIGNVKCFLKEFKNQIRIIMIIGVMCEATAYLCGIPILSMIYGTDLSKFKVELAILLLGGVLAAVATLLSTFMTVIRKQEILLAGYCLMGLLSPLVCNMLTSRYGILGASVAYTVLMGTLCIIFAASFWVNVRAKIT